MADLKEQIMVKNPNLMLATSHCIEPTSMNEQKKTRMNKLNRLSQNLNECKELDERAAQFSEYF